MISLASGVSALQELLTDIERSMLLSLKERRDDQFKDFFKRVDALKDFLAHEDERRIIPWLSEGVKVDPIAFEHLRTKKKDKKTVIFTILRRRHKNKEIYFYDPSTDSCFKNDDHLFRRIGVLA